MRALIVILGVALLALQYRLWLSDDGFRAAWSLDRAVEDQKAENAQLTDRNDHLEAEVRDLKDGLEAVEEIARNDLGMIIEGETFYQVAADEGDEESSDR